MFSRRSGAPHMKRHNWHCVRVPIASATRMKPTSNKKVSAIREGRAGRLRSQAVLGVWSRCAPHETAQLAQCAGVPLVPFGVALLRLSATPIRVG